MKYIYIAFLASNYKTGRFIRKVTRQRYRHVVISKTEDISKMYSFARRYKNTPFVAGFVCENLSRSTLGSAATPVKICRLALGEDEYAAFEEKLAPFIADPEKYRYNYFGAGAYIFRRQWKKKTAFTCLEFVLYLLNIEKFMTIAELERHLKDAVIFEGFVEELPSSGIPTDPDDPYFQHKSVAFQVQRLAADAAALVRGKRRE